MPVKSTYFDADRLVAGVVEREQATEAYAQETVAKLTNEAGAAQRIALEQATTMTGDERVRTHGASSKFGSVVAGRVNSALMINTTSARTTIEDGIVAGTWGWMDPEDYFLDQDWGTRRGIPAAHSLLNTFIVAREKLFAAVEALTGSR